MNIKKSILLRVRLAFLAVFLFSLAIIWRLVSIQVLNGEKWRKKADEVGLQVRNVPATRGNIYSDNGSLLATSLPFYKVAFDPTTAADSVYLAGIDSLSMLLSNFYKDYSYAEYKRKIRSARNDKKKYIVLNRKMINYQEMVKMKTWPIFRTGRYKGGVLFTKIDKRFKPFSQMALRTLGYMTEDRQGAGLEYSFNAQLGGSDGKAMFRKMAGGVWKPLNDENEISPNDGIDIQTTIDVNLQDVAEASLKSHIMEHDADNGCVILMEVATGEIKAMANFGKDKKTGLYNENYNYAVGNHGLTEPGSTFKLVSMMALLENTNLNIDDTVDTYRGKHKYYDKTMTDSKPEGYGKISVRKAFEQSSNIGISKMVQKYYGKNPNQFREFISDLKLDQPIGFQLTGEAKPYIKKPRDSTWSGITLPWMSIGYELKLSPLHVITLYNAVANDGKMISPILVKGAFVADDEIEKYEARVINEKICSDGTLEELKKLLVGVVENGTAMNIKTSNYKIAGKTGTAQKIVNRAYTKSYYTSFVGFFPAEKPKYTCIAVIDNPKGFRQYGSNVAAPIFKEIADKIYSLDQEMLKTLASEAVENNFPVIRGGNLDELQMICNRFGISNHTNTSAEWVGTQTENKAVIWRSKLNTRSQVPDVLGFSLKDAIYILENKGLHVVVAGSGRVREQSITPGARLSKGQIIYLRLS